MQNILRILPVLLLRVNMRRTVVILSIRIILLLITRHYASAHASAHASANPHTNSQKTKHIHSKRNKHAINYTECKRNATNSHDNHNNTDTDAHSATINNLVTNTHATTK
eukprot:7999177-Pyramimonas_sp.AAC.1